MARKTLKEYWKPSFEALYNAYFYELASEHIIKWWYRIDLALLLSTAIAVVASAVSGWVLWANPHGKIVWGWFAGTASVLATFHCVLAVPARIKKEVARRQLFFALRIELQGLRNNLVRNMDVLKAEQRFEELRARLHECVSNTPPDIVWTLGARMAVQKLVNEKLKKYTDGRTPSVP